jgi:Na+-driven multidrug efflux pump
MFALCGTAAALLYRSQLMGLFTKDFSVIKAGARFLAIEAFVMPAYVLLYINVSAMQGIRMPMFGLTIGLYRQIAGPLFVFHLFTTVMGLGLVGVWWGILVITWSAALIVVVYVGRTLANLEKDLIKTCNV